MSGSRALRFSTFSRIATTYIIEALVFNGKRRLRFFVHSFLFSLHTSTTMTFVLYFLFIVCLLVCFRGKRVSVHCFSNHLPMDGIGNNKDSPKDFTFARLADLNFPVTFRM